MMDSRLVEYTSPGPKLLVPIAIPLNLLHLLTNSSIHFLETVFHGRFEGHEEYSEQTELVLLDLVL